jgi:tight adherence protein B
MTLAVAAVAAAAIFLIAIGIATSGNGSGVSARLERYASARESGKSSSEGGGGLAELLEKSVALAQLNRVVEARDFGANLARDIARADLKLKPSEFLALWAGSIVGVPLLFIVFSLGLPALRAPLALIIGAFIGFMLPRFWLGRRKSGRLGAFNKQLPDTITLLANGLRAGSSFLQAVELVVRESRPPMSTEFNRVIL